MNYSSLTLKDSTHSRVNMLLARDFQNFHHAKSHGLLEVTPKSFWSKKTLLYAFAFIGALLMPTGHELSAQESQTQTFIATAYYTPLPNQQNYYRGSYEADKALNGNGTHGADGTKVFAGMIAAPKNYPFGTKIELDGIGIVSVHDRGGAITSTPGGADRIDIWMGYGDEGLKRTIAWGRREITGRIVHKNTTPSIQLETILQKTPNTQQIVLSKLEKLGYKTAGRKFAEVIIEFQLKENIIPSKDDPGAGHYGPKTSRRLNELSKNNTPKTAQASPKTHITQTTTIQNITYSEEDAKIIASKLQTVPLGQKSEYVVNLQEFLYNKGFFSEIISGEMNLATLRSLRNYQYSRNIGQTGRIDLRTRQQIIEDLQK